MILITFLGTVSGVPTKNRNHPAIAIEYFSKKRDVMLWDCGEGTQKQLMKAGISFMDLKQIYIIYIVERLNILLDLEEFYLNELVL